MNPTHYVQIALAIIVAAGGAAVPLVISPMTPTAWILLVVAIAAAIGKVLSVQSEVQGDKPPTAANSDAEVIAAECRKLREAQRGFVSLRPLFALGVLSAIFTASAIISERTRGPEASLQKDFLWGLAAGCIVTIVARL